MPEDFIATKTITIHATPSQVWQALTTPEMVKQFMFGAQVVSDWKVGSPLIYKGEWEGKAYEEKGTILAIEPDKLLKTTFFSPMSGKEDKPENYNVITYELAAVGDDTTLTITQTNNASQESATQSEANWGMVLTSIKELLEK